jgi:hypothetical protein
MPIIWMDASPAYSSFFSTVEHLSDINDNAALMAFMQTDQSRNLFVNLVLAFIICHALWILLMAVPMMFTKEKTGLHDYLMKTRVFKKGNASIGTPLAIFGSDDGASAM